MAHNSKISWTETTWNFLLGCSKVSPGCVSCYAVRQVHRMAANPNAKVAAANAGLTAYHANGKLDWTGQVNVIDERLLAPLSWKKPRRVFVNSLSDLFHEEVDEATLNLAFAVMAVTPQHQYQILTKRPQRMHGYLSDPERHRSIVISAGDADLGSARAEIAGWPLPNVWLGVSVEDQARAAERIPLLLKTPAAIRWISAEPLLGPLNLMPWLERFLAPGWLSNRLDWVVAGGESGGANNRRLVVPCTEHVRLTFNDPGHCVVCGGTDWRPKQTALTWARSLRDQCQATGVAFFWKQWGGPRSHSGGNLLDGRTWQEYPAVQAVADAVGS